MAIFMTCSSCTQTPFSSPQVKGMRVKNCKDESLTCPVSQAEPYYLQVAFRDNRHLGKLKSQGLVISPVLDFSASTKKMSEEMLKAARKLGHHRTAANKAMAQAWADQEEFLKLASAEGSRFMSHLGDGKYNFGIVILGRPYNAYVSEAHMGIPQKFATRGIPVVPVDFFTPPETGIDREMYWSAGKTMLRGAEMVSNHPRLFGCFISNFSCGPDSFIVGFVRDIMGSKPLLVLELDSHVADAGLETRIEAFIDVIRNYLELQNKGRIGVKRSDGFRRAYYDSRRDVVVDSKGVLHRIDDPRVHVVFPSMGNFLNEAAAAVFRGAGIRASALPPADLEDLKTGRGNSSCKECLPLLLTTGSLLNYIRGRKDPDEVLVYFMATAGGPCRFGQYSVFMRKLIEKYAIRDVTLMSISSEDSYLGFKGRNMVRKLWFAVVSVRYNTERPVVSPDQFRRPAILNGHLQAAVAQSPLHDGKGH